MGLYAEIVAMEEHDITINWKPIDGLVIVSDKAADYDAVADTSRNVNIWNDVSGYSGILKAYHSETGYKDVLFKYGSLIAVHSGTSAGEGFIVSYQCQCIERCTLVSQFIRSLKHQRVDRYSLPKHRRNSCK